MWFAVQLAKRPSTCLIRQRTQLARKEAEMRLTAGKFISKERYKKTFYFTALARNAVKPSRLKGSATQALQLSRQPLIQVFIKCVANCGQLMNPSYRFVLSAQCKICHNMSYAWQLHVDDSTKNNVVKRLEPNDTMLGLRDPVLNVNPYVFATGLSETYVIVLSGELLSVDVSVSSSYSNDSRSVL